MDLTVVTKLGPDGKETQVDELVFKHLQAKLGKLVNREVTQILSPGTHFDERMLVAERNNFLAAVYPSGKIYGLALVDLTTGDFVTTELDSDAALQTELDAVQGEDPFIGVTLDAQQVSEIISSWTGIPVGKMLKE